MVLPLIFASPLFWIIVGVAAMLIYFAFQPLIVRPVQELVSYMPIWGNDLKRAVGQAGADVQRALGEWAGQQLQGVTEFLSVPIRAAHEFVEAVSEFIDATVVQINAVARAASLEIGAAGRAIQQLNVRVAAAATAAAGAAAQIPRLWSEANRIARVLIPAAIGAATAGVMQSVGVLLQREALLRGRAIDDQRVATGRAIDGEANARLRGDADTRAAGAAAASELLRRLGEAEGRARTYADQRVRPVDDALTHLRDIAVPATLAVALAATNALARDYAQTRARCIDPVCSVISPGLDFLQALGTGAMVLTVLGMVGDAVRDPQGAANDTALNAGSIIAGARDVLSPFVPAQG